MKTSGFISIVIMIGLCFAMVGSMMGEFQTSYPSLDVNTSWANKYNYAEEISGSMDTLQTKFATLSDPDAGWFAKLGAGITAIPNVVIAVPTILIKTIGYITTIVSDVGEELKIPSFVITLGLTSLIVIIIFGLISFWHRSKA